MRRILIVAILIFILLGLFLFLNKKSFFLDSSYTYFNKDIVLKKTDIVFKKKILPQIGTSKIVVTLVGNIEPSLFVENNNEILGGIGELLRKDDITIANAVGLFNEDSSKNIFYKGIDAFSLAGVEFINNTNEDILKSLNILNMAKIPYLGIGSSVKEAQSLHVYEKGNISVGFLSFSDITDFDLQASELFPNINRVRRSDFFDSIKKAKDFSKNLVVILHAKDSEEKHTYRNELLSREIIDIGADMVVVVGPKNIFDIEEYHGKYIVYSLGNFLVKNKEESGAKGLAVQLQVDEGGLSVKNEYFVSHNPKPEVDKFFLIETRNSESIESSYMRILGDRKYVYKNLSIYEKSNTKKGKVAITIDDGYDIENVQKAIEIFDETNTVATFFPIGEQLALYPSVWKKAVDVGIEFGNHTKKHPWITHLSANDFKKELEDWDSAFSLVSKNETVRFFRPPYKDGFTADSWLPNTHVDILKNKELDIALWSIDSYKDEYLLNEDPSFEETVEAILLNVKDGDIILIHFDDRDIEALPYIISKIKEKGLEPVTLSELLSF